jgi:hypothetical protein
MLAKLDGSSDDSNTGINDYSGIDESVEHKEDDEAKAALSRLSTVMGSDYLYEGVGFGPNASDLDKNACRKVFAEALEGRPGAEYEMGNILANGMYCILVIRRRHLTGI